jgi:xanthine/CO dehydrogenase XdhC/CoxF family maturation factor
MATAPHAYAVSRYRTSTTAEQALAEAMYLAALGSRRRRCASVQLVAERLVAEHGLDEHDVELAKIRQPLAAGSTNPPLRRRS